MTEPSSSPWAQQGSDGAQPEFTLTPPVRASAPIAPRHPVDRGNRAWASRHVADEHDLQVSVEPIGSSDVPIDEATQSRRRYKVFGSVAAGVLAVGLVIILTMVMTGRSPFQGHVAGPPNVAPPLARACPAPTGPTPVPQSPPPTPKGERTLDERSGISYRAYGSPWQTWHDNWNDSGELKVSYRTGQFFVTESYPGGEYLASILSGSVPATDNDALALDLKCTGHQVAADVRASYYPEPNVLESIKDQAVVLGGRPAWLDEFRLHFDEPGLKAKDELVAVALIDVGRPEAAVLYISIPGTHRQYDYVVDEVLASVRPITR